MSGFDQLGVIGPLLLAAGAETTDPGASQRALAQLPLLLQRQHNLTLDRQLKQQQLSLHQQNAERERRRQETLSQMFAAPSPTAALAAGGGPTKAAAALMPTSNIPPVLQGLDPKTQQVARQLAAVDPGAALKMVMNYKPQTPETVVDAEGYRRYLTGRQAGQRVFPDVTKRPKLTTSQRELQGLGLSPEEYKKAIMGKYTPTGMRLETTPEGGVTFTSGPGVTGGELGTAAQTQVQKRILGAGDTLQHLASIRARYRPEFQQIGTRWNVLKGKWKEKLGFGKDVSQAERDLISDFSSFRADAGQLFALTLKDLSGVAVNPTEFQRAQAWLPNPGTGLFDGDSPSELTAKINRFEDFSKRALMKYHYINRHGLTVTDVDVDQIPDIVRKRGDEIYQEVQAQGIIGEGAKIAVKRALIEEFGLAAF